MITLSRLKALAVDTGVPVTFGMFSSRRAPDYWRPFFKLADESSQAGGKMFIQVHSRSLNLVLSFETRDALRSHAGVARNPQAAAGRAGSRRCAIRRSVARWCRPRRKTTRAIMRRSAPSRAAVISSIYM